MTFNDQQKEISFNIDLFVSYPSALQRRAYHLILSYLYKKKVSYVTSWHVHLIRELLQGEHPSGKLDLPLARQRLWRAVQPRRAAGRACGRGLWLSADAFGHPRQRQ